MQEMIRGAERFNAALQRMIRSIRMARKALYRLSRALLVARERELTTLGTTPEDCKELMRVRWALVLRKGAN